MLVLSRKAGQRINIGDDIVVEVRRVAGNRVTIALEAPRDVRILRGELQHAATEFEFEMDDDSADDQPARRHIGTPQLAALTSHIASGKMVG